MGKNMMTVSYSNLLVASVVVVCSAVIGVNCSGFQSSEIASSDSLLKSSDVDVPVAILTSEQMLKSMITVSGIEGIGDLETAEDAEIDAVFQSRTGSLPSVQDIGGATGPTLIAMTNLALAVCTRAIQDEVGRSAPDRHFYRGLNFGAGLNGQSEAAALESFTLLARNAWRREPSSEELQAHRNFIADFTTATTDKNDPVQTKNFAVSSCTSVLASIDTVTY